MLWFSILPLATGVVVPMLAAARGGVADGRAGSVRPSSTGSRRVDLDEDATGCGCDAVTPVNDGVGDTAAPRLIRMVMGVVAGADTRGGGTVFVLAESADGATAPFEGGIGTDIVRDLYSLFIAGPG